MLSGDQCTPATGTGLSERPIIPWGEGRRQGSDLVPRKGVSDLETRGKVNGLWESRMVGSADPELLP